MKCFLTCIIILAAGAALTIALAAKMPPEVGEKDSVTIFLTGNTLGSLKPCGCFGGQLGGFERRPAVFETVPRKKRLIVDTGELVADAGEQSLIKFDIIFQAFSLLHYDVVNLAKRDLEIARNRGLVENTPFRLITAQQSDGQDIPNKFTAEMQLQNKLLCVNIASVADGNIAKIRELFCSESDGKAVNILIAAACDTQPVKNIAESGVVDVLICPADTESPRIIDKTMLKPLVISVGRLGEYVGKLKVTRSPEGKLKISYTAIPLTESLGASEPLVELYRTYQQLVSEANLLEQYPQVPLLEGLVYLGSESCKLCHVHRTSYEKWSAKPHAKAYDSLVKVGSQCDPECVICHVVGMEYTSGFVSPEKTPYLKDVGCEACHGPGSEHIRTLGRAKTRPPQRKCLDCHTPERSAGYAGHEQEYLDKIEHWLEPNEPNAVK